MTGKGPNQPPFASFADFAANVRQYVAPVKVSVPVTVAAMPPPAAPGAMPPVVPGAPPAGETVNL